MKTIDLINYTGVKYHYISNYLLFSNDILKSLEEPLKQIAINAGLEGAVILEKVKSSKQGVGFDAAKEEYVDMKSAGIVDPTKVTRSALQNAASIASMILTTESIVTEKKENKCNCHEHEQIPQDMY